LQKYNEQQYYERGQIQSAVYQGKLAPEEPQKLANKLARLSMDQRIALIDVLERLFRGFDGIGSDLREQIQAAGLVLKEGS